MPMNMTNLTALLAFVAGLSVATERITEVIKGLWPWLTTEKRATAEEVRKAVVHILAIAIGAVLAWLSYSQVASVIGSQAGSIGMYLLFGAMASGGSGLWNSVLDIVRETNRQKQVLTDKLKAN